MSDNCKVIKIKSKCSKSNISHINSSESHNNENFVFNMNLFKCIKNSSIEKNKEIKKIYKKYTKDFLNIIKNETHNNSFYCIYSKIYHLNYDYLIKISKTNTDFNEELTCCWIEYFNDIFKKLGISTLL